MSRLSDVVCSTDDMEIADCAKDHATDVIIRPGQYAGDESPTIDTVRHALDCVGWEWHAVVVLQPTNPLRTADDIDAALLLLERTDADSVLAVTACDDHHPARMYYQRDDATLERLPWLQDTRRQDQAPLWFRDGSIYACRPDVIRSGSLVGESCLPLVIPRERSLRIDERHDLELAEFLLTRHRQPVS